ncbi:Cro/CI family transcriptional regulator [Acinetobacter sp. ABJ_C1_1]|uniref:Cro/CI family transcriptional regulator n=1 Tax=Acinetobacter sp. ABJ_C1_1 TaxID=3378321 RepID=UPI0037DC4C34
MNVIMRKKDALDCYHGNQSALAGVLGITRQAVNQWGKFIPDEAAAKLALLNPQIPYQILGHKKAPVAENN